MRVQRTIATIAVVGLLVTACATHEAAIECANEVFPPTSGTVVHVAACGTDGNDGSAARPLRTLAAATGRVQPGQTIAVAAGTYAESVTLPAGVTLAGSAVVLAPSASFGIRIPSGSSPTFTTISGISISGAQGFAIGSAATSLDLRDVSIHGTQVDSSGKGGHGVEIHGAAQVTISGVDIRDNSGVGIVTFGCGSVSILDPSFLPNPLLQPRNGQNVGVDPAWKPVSIIAKNAGGGVAFLRKDGSAVGILDPSFLVGGVWINQNGVFGVGSWGVPGSVSRSAVTGTVADAKGAFGLGIFVNNPDATVTQAEVDAGCVVANHAQTGVFVAGASSARVAASVSGNLRGGAWAQGAAAGLEVQAAALFSGNTWLGIGVAQGAQLQVAAATVRQTAVLEWVPPAGGLAGPIADGIGIFDGAHATLTGTILQENARAGLVAHNPAVTTNGFADVTLHNVQVTASDLGLALTQESKQKVPTSWQDGVQFQTVKTTLDAAAKIAVTSSACLTAQCLPDLTNAAP